MTPWEWAVLLVVIALASLLYVHVLASMVTRAIVRSWLEERAATNRRLYQEKTENSDGE